MHRLTAIYLVAVATWGSSAHPIARLKRQVSELRPTYDFIIAGGGTAGLTVADRLTEAFPNRTVLVVEYGEIQYAPGQFDPPVSGISQSKTFGYESLPIPGLNNRRASVAVGKIVGGSSAVNGMFFDRGSRHCYDDWAKVGSPEFDNSTEKWDWDGIFPYFKKSVTFTEPSKEDVEKYGYTWDVGAYGGKTPIFSSYPPYQWGAQKLGWKAYEDFGIAPQRECAGGDKSGICWVPTSQHPVTARRSHAGLGHYAAVNETRPNYDLLVKHKVRRVFYDSKDTKLPPLVEIETLSPGARATRFNVRANLEVILATGAIHTPQILQRSGIGKASLLNEANISVIADLPGVGYNFQDHGGAGASFSLNQTMLATYKPSQSDMQNPAFAADARKGWDETPARGPYTTSMGNSALYLSLPNVTSNYTRIVDKIKGMVSDGSFASYLPNGTDETVVAGYKQQLSVLAEFLANPTAPVLETPFSGGPSAGAFHLKPLSRGTVLIDPKNPDGEPILDYRTATNPVDMDIMAEFIRFYRRMFSSPFLQSLGAVEVRPGARVQSDEDIHAYIREAVTMSFMHPCCTAAMMPKEKGGVVGPNLKVYGLPGLRVVDLSIMPLLVGSHTSSTAYAVGEKGAAIIVEEYSQGPAR